MANPSQPDLMFSPAELRGKRLHFMGIGGSGITAVAQMALLAGAICTGCEQTPSKMTEWIAAKGLPVAAGHSAEHLAGVDALVITPAITTLNPRNPEVVAARERGIPVIEWQALLGAFMVGRCGVSVAGVHGKGTTTAMLSAILIEAGLDPTCEVGAILPTWGGNVRLGEGPIFVNEADEFNLNFLHYHPRLAVITGIEFEHPEFFRDFHEMESAFDAFVAGMDLAGPWDVPATLALNWESPGCRALRARMASWPGATRVFALEGVATLAGAAVPAGAIDYLGRDVRLTGETSFRVVEAVGERDLGVFTLRVPGRFNVENALAAITLARELGVAPEPIRRALATFPGLNRRFQVIPAAHDITLIDDYAHHPTAIALVLETTRQRYPDRRIIAAFQPNIYTRLKTLLTDFSHSFGDADEVFIVEIHPGREVDTGMVHGRDLAGLIQRDARFAGRADHVRYGGTVDETRAAIAALARPGDVIALLGSGPIGRAAGQLLAMPEFAGHGEG